MLQPTLTGSINNDREDAVYYLLLCWDGQSILHVA
jgi:hypothetical protein